MTNKTTYKYNEMVGGPDIYTNQQKTRRGYLTESTNPGWLLAYFHFDHLLKRVSHQLDGYNSCVLVGTCHEPC